MKFTFSLPHSLLRRSLLNVVLAILGLVFLIFFVKNERLQLPQVKSLLLQVDTGWALGGLFLTVAYLTLQGYLYVASFRTIGAAVSLPSAIRLFLKRNFVSTFLPAGTFTSLAFFEEELSNHQLTKSQIRHGSFLFALASLISVAVVAVPVILLLLFQDQLRSTELLAFASLILLTIVLVLVGSGIRSQSGAVYRILSKISPSLLAELNEVTTHTFNARQFRKACLVSIAIELVGVAHLYVSMSALGLTGSWEASFVGYVIMVLILSFSPFLKGLGAIEVSVAYILTLYGMPTAPAAAVTLLFRIFEFWLPFLAGMVALFLKRGNLLLRVFPAVLLFALGLTNILSALTPAIPSRIRLLREFLPLELAEFSNVAVLLVGVVLIVCSAFLLTGARNAWKIALGFSAISLIGHLTKAIDFEEALFALTTAATLVYTRHAYFVKHDLNFQVRAATIVSIATFSLFLYAIVGFYFLDPTHFGLDFSLQKSIRHAVGTMIFLSTDIHPLTSMGRYFLVSIQIGSVSVIGYMLYSGLRIFRSTLPADPDHEEARYLAEHHGNSSLDYFKTQADKKLFFNADKTSFLAYREAGNFAVVLENPVAKDVQTSTALVKDFEQSCREQGMHAFYYRVPEEDVEIYRQLRKRAILIGQEGIIKLSEFSLSGKDQKALRNAVHKVENLGLHFNGYHAPLKDGFIQQLRSVSTDWLGQDGHAEAGFSQGIFDEQALKATTVFTVENQEGKILAFVNIIPSYKKGEATYDLMRYVNPLPNGTLDFLMVRLIGYFLDLGFETLNLGMVPLATSSGDASVNAQLMKFYFEMAQRFRGSFEYKNKFSPHWENRYLIYDQAFDLVRFPALLKVVSKPIE